MTVWGLNYFRHSFEKQVSYNTQNIKKEELEEMCRILINKTNTLRAKVKEGEDSTMMLSHHPSYYLKEGWRGYQIASSRFPQVAIIRSRPKGFVFPELWAYLGTAGIYIPFTAEPNLNMEMPHSSIPAIICHELAHKVGFAKEDEANYLGYLACKNHPDPDFKYSGVFSAMRNSMNLMYALDSMKYNELKGTYSQGVKRDLQKLRTYWKKFDTKSNFLATRFYDKKN